MSQASEVSRVKGYFLETIKRVKELIKNSKNHKISPKQIQQAMCANILWRWDDYAREYKQYKKFQKCANMEEFLTSLFETDLATIQHIVHALSEYKNITGDVAGCMRIEIYDS